MRAPIVVGPGEGRAYRMPGMEAVFKADGAETGDRYSISHWLVEPGCPGPGPHSHEDSDEIFLVTEGTLSVLVGEEWVEAVAGTVLVIPAGTVHDFANRGTVPAGLFNVYTPGRFEENMPAILEWYARQGSGQP